jgi:hypothetical protein
MILPGSGVGRGQIIGKIAAVFVLRPEKSVESRYMRAFFRYTSGSGLSGQAFL